MFLIEGPRTASIEEGHVFLGLYHSYREGERVTFVLLSQSSRRYRLMRIQHGRVRLAISTDKSGGSVTGPPR